MNKPLFRIGIIGGAGPLAGALLFEKIIQICQNDFGCSRDGDFPFITLLSYPFAEMLNGEESDLIKEQLNECFHNLIGLKTDYAVIACNTIHAFLPPVPRGIKLIHLIQETLLTLEEKTLVLCTSTAAKYRLHAPCSYPAPLLQKRLDEIIDRILAGEPLMKLSKELAHLINHESISEILLGCTELSLLNVRAPLHSFGLDKKFKIRDPFEIVSKKITSLLYGSR